MSHTIRIFASLLLLGMGILRAQDPSYAIIYSHPMLLTPSFAGLAMGDFNATISHRSRVTTPTTNFNTSILSANLPVHTNFAQGGLGLLVGTDVAGGIRTTDAQLAFSYEAPLGTKVRYHHLRAGFQFGMVQRQLIETDFKFEDQFDGLGFNLPTGDKFDNISVLSPDISMGLMWYRTQKIKGNPEFNHYLGFALHHINRPSIGFFDQGQEKMNMRSSLIAGGRLRTRTPFDFNVNFGYMMQNNSSMWNASFFARYVLYENNVWFGREKAAFMLGGTLRNMEAATVFGGFQLQRTLTLGFGYDFLVTQETLAPTAYGGMQVMCSYLFGGQKYRNPEHPFPSF